MCRIVGIIDFNKSLGNEIKPIVISMRDFMIHGGPDDAGFYISGDKKVALGHRRLSIIDLSSLGHQPMSNKDETIWITYNGEIYNFQELRNELITIGYHFKSRTDTEVLIYGYEEWGIEKLLSKLRGMFAFAIYDSRRQENDFKLILAKDRFGIKPLYYYFDNKKFVFASEVKAFVKSRLFQNEINKEALIRFLQLGSIPNPLTTVKNVYSLEASHYLVLSENKIDIKRYWDLSSYFSSSVDCSLSDAIATTRNLLYESVKLHLISDVPLGIFLSGGIDSSSLVAIASKMIDRPLNTLSVLFDEENYSEKKYFSLIADKYKTNHHEVLVTQKDFYNELPNIFNAMDQPTIDGINTYFVSKAAKETGLTVVLSGIGGDEVFLGYKHYKYANYLQSFSHLPQWSKECLINLLVSLGQFAEAKSVNKLAYLKDESSENSYLVFRGLFTQNEIQELLGVSKKEYLEYGLPFKNPNSSLGGSLIKSFDYLDFTHYLQNQILKDTDFMSMTHGIEVRVPFLDHFLASSVVQIDPKIKCRNGINKPVLVKSLGLGKSLPHEIYSRKKTGFTFPFNDWLRSVHHLNMFKEVTFVSGLFNRKVLEDMWEDFNHNKLHWSRVWALVVLSKLNKSATIRV